MVILKRETYDKRYIQVPINETKIIEMEWLANNYKRLQRGINARLDIIINMVFQN